MTREELLQFRSLEDILATADLLPVFLADCVAENT